LGYVISRTEWTKYHKMPTNGDFVIIKITSSPGDKKGDLEIFNNIFPVRRGWLRSTGRLICICDLVTQIMRYGCGCGGA